MEIKKLEKCDYVMFPRLQEQGVESRHVEREAFRAELKHVEGHGDYWLVYQQAPPHLVANIQFAGNEAEFDRKLGWFIGQQKLHEFVRGDLSFISALAGYNREEVPMQFPDRIKSIVYALSDSARCWHEYGLEVMESKKK